jgi:hypothetical protein
MWGVVDGCGGENGTPPTGDVAETETCNISIMVSIKSREIKQVMNRMHNIKVLAALTSVCVSLKPYNFWTKIVNIKHGFHFFKNSFCFNPLRIQPCMLHNNSVPTSHTTQLICIIKKSANILHENNCHTVWLTNTNTLCGKMRNLSQQVLYVFVNGL